MRWLNCVLMVAVALGLVSCAAETEGVSWLMVQNAEGVSFVFDDAVDAACPEEAFWSGTMTMTGADEETLFFSDRPNRYALTLPTSRLVEVFDEAFAPDSGGYPNAVLNWEDAATSEQRAVVVELSSPSFDASTSTLVYSVCGLRMDNPETLMPFPDDQQTRPELTPDATGRFSLFIDPDCPAAFSYYLCGDDADWGRRRGPATWTTEDEGEDQIIDWPVPDLSPGTDGS